MKNGMPSILRDPAMKLKQRGVGLVEIMIALTVALFLLFGLSSIFITTRATYKSQNSLAGLQDNERLAMTLLGSIIQSAGYFPYPSVANRNTALPAATGPGPLSVSFAAGQSISGGTVGGNDSVVVRYMTAPGDTIFNCMGGTNTGATNTVYYNTFTLSGNTLYCSVNGATAQPLVSGVSGITVLYGVDAGGSGSASAYLPEATVTSTSSWDKVKSVQVTLNFVNPLVPASTIPFTRVISVMGQL